MLRDVLPNYHFVIGDLDSGAVPRRQRKRPSNWQVTGKVAVRKVQRAPGTVGFVFRTKGTDRESFSFAFLHR